MTVALAALDWAILAAYALAVVGIGAMVSRKATSGEELFLAGRSLGFFAIGLSLFASNISSTTLIGLSGAAYSSGISVAHYELWAALILVVMAIVTIPVFLRMRLTTVPEYLGRRFGLGAQKYASAVTIFLSIFVDTAASVYAGVIVIQVFAPEAPFVPTCLALAAFAGLYTAAGGLRAVVYTDVLQAIVLIVGACAIALTVFGAFDFSWERATAAVDPEKLSLIRPLDDPALPWLGALIGAPILGFYYWSTNQYIVQRVLGARSLADARNGAMLAAGLKLLPLFIMVLPGAFAIALLPDLESGDQVFPAMIAELLPVGLKGLVLAGLLAAIMSTIDSTLNAASTLVVHDFAGGKEWPPERSLRVGRLVTLGFIVIAGLWPLVIRDFPGLFNYIQQVFGYAVPPIAAVFLLALFWPRMTGVGAIATLVFGHVLGAGVFVYRAMAAGSESVVDVLPHFTIVAGLTLFACVIVGVVVSLATTRSAASAVAEGTWRPADARPAARPTTVLGDYRLWALLIVMACCASVAAFP